MAVRAATSSFLEPRGFSLGRRLFSNFSFPPLPSPSTPPPPAEPSTNLFVSGLSKRTTDEGLREAFAKFGEVLHAKVATERGYSKGFGFVRYATLEQAAAGIAGMDGKFLDGWVIFAEYSRPKPPPQNNGGRSYNTPPSSRRY
ncbi:hypothetical protein MKW94_003570 [Papaver nudicaule]|uniref:RRM domain-containing protein n=1 Tax=Papaver nudicaule TaxID=74823 RepID=A0AA41VEQ0_PAPNU|nr:hypothetical protein [Papaver nudicaule]